MSGQAAKPAGNSRLPKDAAQIVLWFRGLPQPTAFLTSRDEAEKAAHTFADSYGTTSSEAIEFLNYADGSGTRSRTIVPVAELRALTIEYPTIELAS